MLRCNSWGGAGVPPNLDILLIKVSPVIACICCDKALLSVHTVSTNEGLLTHQNVRDDCVIVRHV